MSDHAIAVIPGDGIGIEVIREGQLTLETLAEVTGDLVWEFQTFPWGCEYYLDKNEMMPANALKTLESFDAIYFGACGFPSVPDPISQREMILLIRQSFQQYANIRPVRIWPGVPSPLSTDRLDDIDFICVRENSEGEYAGAGGRVHRDTEHEVALQTTVFTRVGVERVIRHAFELASRLGRNHITNVTKSNALQYAPVFWDEVFTEIASEYPAVTTDRSLVDACAARMVSHPQTLDVLVASNLFGDILSDVGGALMGSLGVPPSANLNPDGSYPPMFEPVHGSAPDIAGKEIANPMAALWSAAMMVEELGHPEASSLLLSAMADVTASGLLTVDLGGTASTSEFGTAVRTALKARAS
jgi:tartrate dehydrogenase/decarboxylase/D-malate dehydrogenase